MSLSTKRLVVVTGGNSGMRPITMIMQLLKTVPGSIPINNSTRYSTAGMLNI